MTLRFSRLAFLLVAGLALAGCSSTPTRINKGPLQARTFSFLDTHSKGTHSFSENEPEIHARVQEAITRNLAAKGVSKVASGSDITVGYLILVSDAVSTRMINDYFGYGLDAAELQEKAHGKIVVDDKNKTPYPAGTLVIDVVNSKTGEIVQRSYAVRPIMAHLPLSERVARLQSAVDEALKDLRIAR